MEQINSNENNQSINQSQRNLKNIFLFLFLLITISVLTGVIVYVWQNKIFSKKQNALQQQLSTITNELNKTKQINNELQQTIDDIQLQANQKVPVQTNENNPTTKIDSILSPNGAYEVYLEKEFDNDIKRYIRQGVVLLNKNSGEKKILNEERLTSEEALSRYSEDGCNEDGVCCNSLIDFNEFKPIQWLNNEMVVVEKYWDNYECAGTLVKKFVYNTEGEEYFDDNLIKQVDFTTNDYDNEGWTIKNICNKPNNILSMIIQKTDIWGGYSYVEYNITTKTFSNQLIEKEKPYNIPGFHEFLDNCSKILDEKEIKKYFNEK